MPITKTLDDFRQLCSLKKEKTEVLNQILNEITRKSRGNYFKIRNNTLTYTDVAQEYAEQYDERTKIGYCELSYADKIIEFTITPSTVDRIMVTITLKEDSKRYLYDDSINVVFEVATVDDERFRNKIMNATDKLVKHIMISHIKLPLNIFSIREKIYGKLQEGLQKEVSIEHIQLLELEEAVKVLKYRYSEEANTLLYTVDLITHTWHNDTYGMKLPKIAQNLLANTDFCLVNTHTNAVIGEKSRNTITSKSTEVTYKFMDINIDKLVSLVKNLYLPNRNNEENRNLLALINQQQVITELNKQLDCFNLTHSTVSLNEEYINSRKNTKLEFTSYLPNSININVLVSDKGIGTQGTIRVSRNHTNNNEILFDENFTLKNMYIDVVGKIIQTEFYKIWYLLGK